MRKLITIIAISLPALLMATPAFAQTVPTTSTGMPYPMSRTNN